MLTVAELPGPAITSLTAFPLTSVPVIVKFLPVSLEPPEVTVTLRAGTKVASPPESRAPVMVRFPAPLGVWEVDTPSASTAAI